jgi:hypothetical protein
MADDIRSRIDSITVEDVRTYAVDYAPKEIVMVTIGPEPLRNDCLQAAAATV